MAPRTVDGRPVPGLVRVAVGLNRVVGVLALVSGIGAAVVAVGPGQVADAASEAGINIGRVVVIGLLSLAVGAGLLFCAPGLRVGVRASRLWSIGLHGLSAAPSLVLNPRGGWLAIAIAAIAVAVLVAPSTRSWTDLSPEDRDAVAAEDRQIRRAQRRLADEAPSLRDISLAPRETDKPRHQP